MEHCLPLIRCLTHSIPRPWSFSTVPRPLARSPLAPVLGRVLVLHAVSRVCLPFPLVVYPGCCLLERGWLSSTKERCTAILICHLDSELQPFNNEAEPLGRKMSYPRGITEDDEKPLPLPPLFTRLVLISVGNYGKIGLTEMTATTLLPLNWSTSVEFGGLGMSPVSIGLWMAGYGILDGVLQYIAFPCIVGHFGLRRVFNASIIAYLSQSISCSPSRT
jgi:hypothetical protein